MGTILHILQHAVGADEYGRPRGATGEFYRNRFCTGSGSPDWDACQEANRLGLMRSHEPRTISGGERIFTVTDAGLVYIAEHSPDPPRLSRGQARYRRWLSSAAADQGVTFGAWLMGGGR